MVAAMLKAVSNGVIVVLKDPELGAHAILDYAICTIL